MAGYQRCSSLALVCLLLCHDSMERKPNNPPFNRSNNMYLRFLSRHMPKNAPTSANAAEWQNFLGPNNFAKNDKTISYLNGRERVKAVCSSQGGQQYLAAKKLCISRKKFSFVEVTKTQKNKGNPYTALKVRKHLILACEDGLPIHFEANKGGNKPKSTSFGCRGGMAE